MSFERSSRAASRSKHFQATSLSSGTGFSRLDFVVGQNIRYHLGFLAFSSLFPEDEPLLLVLFPFFV